MYCTHCGKEIEPGNKFCIYCGTPADLTSPTSDPQATADATVVANTQAFGCPNCGNQDLKVVTETEAQTAGKDYSASKGCCGYILLGPIGLLCGACGGGKKTTVTNTTYFVCTKCGNKFRR